MEEDEIIDIGGGDEVTSSMTEEVAFEERYKFRM
jgi:hypothetical protein